MNTLLNRKYEVRYKTDFRSKFITASIIIFPILNTSHIRNLNYGYGDLLLVLVLLLVKFTTYKSISIHKENSLFWIFVIYLGAVSFFCCLSIPKFSIASFVKPFFRYFFYAYYIYGFKKYFNINLAVDIYIKVCLIESVYLIIQFVLTVAFGLVLPYVCPFLNMEYGMNGAEYNQQLYNTFLYIDGIRGVGFFPEPSHFAQYTIFSLIFLLYRKNKSFSDCVIFFVILIAFILTRSGIGMATLSIVFAIYFCMIKYVNKEKLMKRFAVIVVCLPIVVIMCQKLEILNFIMSRINSIFETQYAVSGNLRLLRGYIIFMKSPLFAKMFGIGCGNFANFINGFNIVTFFDTQMDKTSEFMNGVSTVLIRSGIVGTSILTLYFCGRYIKMKKINRILFLVWCIFMCLENFFFTPKFVLFLCFINANFDDLREKYSLSKI